MALFLKVMCQLKNVVDWKGCQTPKRKTAGSWVSDRFVSAEERNGVEGVSNTGVEPRAAVFLTIVRQLSFSRGRLIIVDMSEGYNDL